MIYTSARLIHKYQKINLQHKCGIREILSQHSMENREILSHRKSFVLSQCVQQGFFREINYLVSSLSKTMFSRNFCQKSVRVNFHNFHTVCHFVMRNDNLVNFPLEKQNKFIELTIFIALE